MEKSVVKPKVLYFVYQDGEDEQYYNQYESMEDAVSDSSNPVEVFEAKLNLLGTFQKSYRIAKVSKKQLKKVKGE